MNDGLAETEIEVPYEVQWGSTFVLRGLEEMTVGAFSLLKRRRSVSNPCFSWFKQHGLESSR